MVYRSQISGALKGVSDIAVVGTAQNGRAAIEKMRTVQADLVIVDLEMPEMNGLEFLEEMRRLEWPVRAIMFSGATMNSAVTTLKALNRGALDFVVKPGQDGEGVSSVHERIRDLLVPRIRQFMQVGLPQVKTAPRWPVRDVNKFEAAAIVVGCSTGGPAALEILLAGIGPALKCPVLIVQHMPPVFTTALAERLSQIAGIHVYEARDGERVDREKIFLAPGGFHMKVRKGSDGSVISLDRSPPRQSVRPSVDVLFESAAQIFSAGCVGIIMTGMGEDGRDGCVAIKNAGGAVLIQDRNSCVVYGMPLSVNASGAFDKEVPLVELHRQLLRLAKQGAN